MLKPASLCLSICLALLAGHQPSHAAPAAKAAAIRFEPAPPELRPWAARAQRLARQWLPRIAARFGRPAPGPITVAFSARPDFVAEIANGRILLSRAYLARNPDDVGVLAHEMTHAIQAYDRYAVPWLIEGIADYVRYYGIETGSRRAGFDLATADYRGGFQAAAFMLRAAEREVGCELVERLDGALRVGANIDAEWFEAMRRTPEQFWRELVSSPQATARIGRPDPSPCFKQPRR